MKKETAENPFKFYTHLHLTELTGRRVRNLPELLDALKSVPGSCIYHHTHRFLKQHQYLSPEPPNDFAYWVTNVLQDDLLGERLASIDIISFNSIRDLRNKLIQTIEDHLKTAKNLHSAPDGDEMNIMKSRTFILPTAFIARNLAEFVDCLKNVSINSLYFHMFESRLRLEKGANDFSSWLEYELGEHDIAGAISRLDPYTQTLERLRTHICLLIESFTNNHA